MSYLENHPGAFHAFAGASQGGNHVQQPRSAQFASDFYATTTIGGKQGLQALASTRAAAANVGARLAIQGLTFVLRGRRCATVGGTSQSGAGPVKHRGRAFIRMDTSLSRCANDNSAPAPDSPQGFHARGLGVGIMNMPTNSVDNAILN